MDQDDQQENPPNTGVNDQVNADANADDSPRRTLAQTLMFVGPLLLAGGILVIWRTGQFSAFYLGLSVIGTATWFIGAFMGATDKHR